MTLHLLFLSPHMHTPSLIRFCNQEAWLLIQVHQGYVWAVRKTCVEATSDKRVLFEGVQLWLLQKNLHEHRLESSVPVVVTLTAHREACPP